MKNSQTNSLKELVEIQVSPQLAQILKSPQGKIIMQGIEEQVSDYGLDFGSFFNKMYREFSYFFMGCENTDNETLKSQLVELYNLGEIYAPSTDKQEFDS